MILWCSSYPLPWVDSNSYFSFFGKWLFLSNSLQSPLKFRLHFHIFKQWSLRVPLRNNLATHHISSSHHLSRTSMQLTPNLHHDIIHGCKSSITWMTLATLTSACVPLSITLRKQFFDSCFWAWALFAGILGLCCAPLY